jgi:hypothetical protein
VVLDKIRYVTQFDFSIDLHSTQGAFVVTVDDNERLILKPQNKIYGLRIGPNELLTALIGREIDAPVLEPQLVMLDEDTLEESGYYDYQGDRNIIPGITFGTHYYQEHVTAANFGDEVIKGINNAEKAIPLLILDSLVGNIDRCHHNNLIFIKEKKQKGSLKMIGIDHGHAFGSSDWLPGWLDIDKVNARVQNHIPILSTLFEENRIKLDKYLMKLEELSRDKIVEIISYLPDEWGVTNQEKLVLVNYLDTRKKLLRKVFEDAFPPITTTKPKPKERKLKSPFKAAYTEVEG